jgi:hypothetical protein
MSRVVTLNIVNELRDLVASKIAGEKAYDVPAVCRRYGLMDGSSEEAFKSKFTYVKTRLIELSSEKVAEIARAVNADMSGYALGEALAKLDEQNETTITELTRRRIIAALRGIPFSTIRNEYEFLSMIWPLDELSAPPDSPAAGMGQHIARHYFRNDDLNTHEVLEALNIYSCSQRQFFRFLEHLVDPLTREAPDQYDLVLRINLQLAIDGYTLQEVGRLSGSPRFQVRKPTSASTPADSEIGKALAAFNPTEIHSR